MEVDLHSHSIYSDGTKSPEELLALARQIDLKVFALTDHDNIEGSKILVSLSHNDITLYSGVELNAKVDKGQMHILGYNFDLENMALNNRLRELKEMSISNIKLYIKLLEEVYNIFLPENEIARLLNRQGNIGRPMLALLLIKYGYCTSVQDAFDKYLNNESVRAYKKNISKEECIRLINDAGGVSVLAHPWSLKMNDSELYKEIAYLKSIGLQGIEIIHSKNNEERRKQYHDLALEFDLLETGGTDYHGKEVKPDIELGSGIYNNVEIKVEDLSILRKVKSRY